LHGGLWSEEVVFSVKYVGHLVRVVIHFILSDPVLTIVDGILGYLTLVVETNITHRDVLLLPAVTCRLSQSLMIWRI
jgi:hypothetical protein